jgi:hypothetical protein
MRLHPACACLRDTADLRSLPHRPPPSWAATDDPTVGLETLRHVIGWGLHLRAAAELKTTGHTWRRMGASFRT